MITNNTKAMKKIMFYDALKHTDMVLKGEMTMDARVIKYKGNLKLSDKGDFRYYRDPEHGKCQLIDDATRKPIEPKYMVGSIVAIAQDYFSVQDTMDKETIDKAKKTGGWKNKMLSSVDIMPNHILIQNVEYKHLQDMTEDEILKCGVKKDGNDYCITERSDDGTEFTYKFNTAREAYCEVIDRILGNGTWENNTIVALYSFKLA